MPLLDSHVLGICTAYAKLGEARAYLQKHCWLKELAHESAIVPGTHTIPAHQLGDYAIIIAL